MVRTKTAPRLTSHAAAAAAAARESGEMATLRFNPEINKIVAEGSDEEEQEELVLHLAQGVWLTGEEMLPGLKSERAVDRDAVREGSADACDAVRGNRASSAPICSSKPVAPSCRRASAS